MKQLLATLASAALFGVMCLVPAVHAIDGDAIGMVQGNLIQGQVFAKSKAGGQRQLTSGASVYEGDTIETVGEGSAVLLLKDGTFWDVFDDSILTIEKYNFSDGGSGDSATYRVHSGTLTYTSGEMGVRGSSIEIKTGNTSIYPQGTEIEFITYLGVTIGRVMEGTARVVTNDSAGTPTDDKVATEGMWFVKDSTGNITVAKNKGQAQKVAKQAYQEAGVGKQSAGVIAAISSILVKKGFGIEVDKDDIGADTLIDTPAEGGSETLIVASPS